MIADTFVCAECLGEFEKGQSDEDAAAEALANFGVADPANRADMAVVCDDCYSRIMSIHGVGAQSAGQALADDFLDLIVETLTEYVRAEQTKTKEH